MGFITTIAWCDGTWNPWRGCRHVSPGCDKCYMFTWMRRWGWDPTVVRRSKTTFRDPHLISYIESGGKVTMQVETLSALAQALDTSTDYLCGLTDDARQRPAARAEGVS
jgi:protein gp37